MYKKDRAIQIKEKADKVRDMLINKNKAYGSSALEPLNIFNKGRFATKPNIFN